MPELVGGNVGRALQLLLRGPWNAIPGSVVKSIKQIGLSSQARDLSLLSQSARIRVASSTSKNVIETYDRCMSMFDDCDEIVLAHLDKKFLLRSPLHHIVFQFRRFVQEFNISDTCGLKQNDIYQQLDTRTRPYDFAFLVSKRLSRHFDEGTILHHVPSILRSYRQSLDLIGFAPTLTHLRTVCNHWCTHSRFGVKRHLCLFGCGHHTDQVAHSSSCPAFWRILCGIVGFDMPLIDIDAIHLLHSSWIGSSNDIRAFVLLGTHICFITYNSCRHGMPISRRLVTHNLYNYTRTHYKVTKLLRRVRYHMRNA